MSNTFTPCYNTGKQKTADVGRGEEGRRQEKGDREEVRGQETHLMATLLPSTTTGLRLSWYSRREDSHTWRQKSRDDDEDEWEEDRKEEEEDA